MTCDNNARVGVARAERGRVGHKHRAGTGLERETWKHETDPSGQAVAIQIDRSRSDIFHLDELEVTRGIGASGGSVFGVVQDLGNSQRWRLEDERDRAGTAPSAIPRAGLEGAGKDTGVGRDSDRRRAGVAQRSRGNRTPRGSRIRSIEGIVKSRTDRRSHREGKPIPNTASDRADRWLAGKLVVDPEISTQDKLLHLTDDAIRSAAEIIGRVHVVDIPAIRSGAIWIGPLILTHDLGSILAPQVASGGLIEHRRHVINAGKETSGAENIRPEDAPSIGDFLIEIRIPPHARGIS